MSKIEANKLEIVNNEFNFEKLMQNIFNVIQVKLEEKHQHIFYDAKGTFTRGVISDELRLSQVLINLLTNAVKFTPEGGTITITVQTSPAENKTSLLRVSIQDTGIGITQEQQSRLFNSFEQADAGITRKFGGTGLGLTICKRIVKLMGGKIWVESEITKGSRFIFEVPIQWGGVVEDMPAESASGNKVRILAVDGDKDVLWSLKNTLTGLFLDCDTVLSFQKAFETATGKTPYDIIFMDWKIYQEISEGKEGAKKLEEMTKRSTLALIVPFPEWEKAEGRPHSPRILHCLPKPIFPSALYSVIVEIMGNHVFAGNAEQNDWAYRWKDKTILVAEDIEINREVISGILEETGVSIENAENGLEAVKMFEKNAEKYDMILMDIQMPEMDGMEATRRIRALEEARRKRVSPEEASGPTVFPKGIPIIAMTANAFADDVKNCMDAGMNTHVSKPIEIDDLFNAISSYLG
jgi:CheY-like chemotaxis protein/two-component sensor histidine kinase